MHGLEEFSGSKPINDGRPWYADMTRYHWFVLIVAALGWLFDCLDQQLFTLARPKAMPELLQHGVWGPLSTWLPFLSNWELSADPDFWGPVTTTVFMLGWATGGLVFGAIGDRIGRAKTMFYTILIYSLCTGLSALSVTVWDFMAYRFITGLGVGGEFAVGVALVAEVMPERARARALSLLQALSAVGNVSAALIGLGLSPFEESGIKPWRVMFIIGSLPALLALLIRARLKEPERFVRAVEEGKEEKKQQAGSYSALLGIPRWRYNAVVGLFLAIPGVVGLWGIGFFSSDLTIAVFREKFAAPIYEDFLKENKDNAERTAVIQKLVQWEKELTIADQRKTLNEKDLKFAREVEGKIRAKLSIWQSMSLLMLQAGAFIGMYSFGMIAQRIGRRPTFLIAFLSAMISTAFLFWNLKEPSHIFWMTPLMGCCQLSLFAGYAIYFPELFPTHLRSTGISFCYNVGRYVAAFGPTIFGLLLSYGFSGPGFEKPMNWRYAGVTMSAVFLVGVIALLFAPETKDKPLPE